MNKFCHSIFNDYTCGMVEAGGMVPLVQVELEGQAVRQEAEAQAREIRVLQMADWAVLEPFGFFHGR